MQTNSDSKLYDCAIIGGGLAGLCLSIKLAKNGNSVILFEKNKYPFHKVCGEYISLESWDYLISLGLDLKAMNLPIIKKLRVSAENGYVLESLLDLGGFGVSRHKLDYELFELAKANGVLVLENCNVLNTEVINDIYTIKTSMGNFVSRIVCGSYGKITPSFVIDNNTKSKGKYVAIKYHLKTNLAADTIELHNFKDGYCGVSKIEEDKYCFCYITTTKNLNNSGNDIKLMEKNILMRNKYLEKYFTHSNFIFDKPIAISKISLNKKFTYHQDIFMLGDAAGAIAPLCGNGMSIAIRASKILADNLNLYFKNQISKSDLIKNYSKIWNENFSTRIKIGYHLQKLFGKKNLTFFALKFLSYFPPILRYIISQTHGEKIKIT